MSDIIPAFSSSILFDTRVTLFFFTVSLGAECTKVVFWLQCSFVFCGWSEPTFLTVWLNRGLRLFGCETLLALDYSPGQLLNEDV